MIASEQKHGQQHRRSLWLLLTAAFILRLAFVLLVPQANNGGGDTPFLISIGHDLLTGTLNVSPATGPVYLIFTGLVQLIFSGEVVLTVIRLLNCLMGAALVGFVYVIGTRYFSARVGWIAALIVAINPIFIIEAGNVLTESPFLALLFGGLALYAVWQNSTDSRAGWWFAAVGALLGLATLTRAVVILLPIVLVIHLIYARRKAAARLIGALLVSYVVVVGAWSVYSTLRWGEFVIGAQGLAANVYLGTTTWCGPQCVDQQAGITTDSANNQNKFVQSAFDTIRADPVGYIKHRLSNLLDSEIQPYNTVFFPGESIKVVIGNWWSHGHALGDLPGIMQSDNFWPKLALYVFHFSALLGGVIGFVLALRQLGLRLVIYGVLGYFLAVHTVLTAVPRYLLPIEPIWILFTAFAVAAVYGLFERLILHRQPVTLTNPSGGQSAPNAVPGR
jgi:4-amino-4-deoxy-L-arabinose transferase-like glycosyltransferase